MEIECFGVCLFGLGWVCLFGFLFVGGWFVKKSQTFSVGKQDTKKEKRTEEIMAAEVKVRALGIVTLNIQICVKRCQV